MLKVFKKFLVLSIVVGLSTVMIGVSGCSSGGCDGCGSSSYGN